MIKNQFQKEIKISAAQSKNGSGNNRKDILKIQSWLNLFARFNPSSGTSTGIDGDFGPATELAVKNYQKAKGITQTGVVDDALFSNLCQPLAGAFQTAPRGNGLRALIVDAAHVHLNRNPLELVINGQANSGPWVRSYMDSNEGEDWLWCMGFVQTILDQAASQLGKDFRKLIPLTYSCDTAGTTGLQKGFLKRFSQVRSNPASVKPGDIFLIQKKPHDWIHTGIIIKVHNDVFETIEGNTNEGGSHNGIGVYRRMRNYMQSKLDVLSVEGLV